MFFLNLLVKFKIFTLNSFDYRFRLSKYQINEDVRKLRV